MKLLILLLTSIALFASTDNELLAKAIVKLMKDNQAMQSEIRMLKIESERLKKLEFELEKIKKNQGSLLSEKERRQIEIFLKSKKTLEQKQQKQQQDIETIKRELRHIKSSKNVELALFKPYMAKVKATTLNIRNGPGTNYATIGSLEINEIVKVEKELISGWYQISYKDKSGWVASWWLTKEIE